MANYKSERLVKAYLTETEKDTLISASHIVNGMMNALMREESSIAMIHDNGVIFSEHDLRLMLDNLRRLGGNSAENECATI